MSASRYAVQVQDIIDHIATHGSITSVEAMAQLGVMRLASRIHDIKNGRGCEAHDIAVEMVTVQDRAGNDCRVARYSFPETRHKAPVPDPAASCRVTRPTFTGLLFDL